MKAITVTLELLLNDDAKTNWIEQVIEDNLEDGETIMGYEVEQWADDKDEEVNQYDQA